MKRHLLCAIALFVATATATAQIQLGEKGGSLSGSIESNSIIYLNDKGLSTPAPEGYFGSNNYLKVDYTNGRFSAGLQFDIYSPALQGYEIGEYLAGAKFKRIAYPMKYFKWQDKNYSVMLGDIFDQFGNGLILRTFEDRQLGFNNSIEGLRATYNFNRYLAIKVLYGRPRLYNTYAGSWSGGADLSVSLGDIIGFKQGGLYLEASYVNRYEGLYKQADADLVGRGMTSPLLNMASGRLNFDIAGLTFRSEYVYKGKDLSTAAASEAKRGQAAYAELGYSYKRFSFSATARMLDNMGTLISLYGTGTGNALNYLPALTRQYTYMLANLNPYQVNAEGEFGGQADIYYTYRSKSDRYRYWNFHANYSTYYTLHKAQSKSGQRERLWQDINFDVERQWSKRLKTTILYSFQEWNPYHGYHHRTYVSNIFVADVQYKFDRKKSLRVEAQYLLSGEYEGDWVAALVEFNLAPHWSIYASDMYNIGRDGLGTKKNYYNAGFSYTYNRTRIQLSYGRNRAGYICSGGVCRYQPEYTGFNLAITSSF